MKRHCGLYYLEAHTEGMLVLVPVGAKQFEAPYLRGATHVFTYAGTHVVIANAHQSNSV